MKKTSILILIILITSLFSSNILATQPPCVIVDNPNFYKNLAFNSNEYSYFKDWKLIDSSVPCRYYKNTDVFLTFELPRDYYLNNYKFNLKIVSSFLDNELENSEQISRLFNNFKQNIINFEDNKEIKLFNSLTSIQLIEIMPWPDYYIDRNSVVKVKSSPDDSLYYNLRINKIEGLVFYNKDLIKKINSFFPEFDYVSQIAEKYFLDNQIDCDIDENDSYARLSFNNFSNILELNCKDAGKKVTLILDKNNNYKVKSHYESYYESFDSFRLFSLSIKYLLIFIIALFLIIALIVYIRKKRK